MINVDFSLVVTILYVIVLYIFLNRFFFGPITRILHQRRELIEGRLEDARKRMEHVELRTSEYELALRNARTEAYRQQEVLREHALAEKAELIARAKAEAEKTVQEGRARLGAQAQSVRKQIESDIDGLAKKLTTAILRD